MVNFVRQLFKSNAGRLADFRKLVGEFESENTRMAAIAAEQLRLKNAMEKVRFRLNDSFAVEDTTALGVATRQLEDFATGAN